MKLLKYLICLGNGEVVRPVNGLGGDGGFARAAAWHSVSGMIEFAAIMRNNVRVSQQVLQAMQREANAPGADVNGSFEEAAEQLLAHRESIAWPAAVTATRNVSAARRRTPCAWSGRTTSGSATGDPITVDTNEYVSAFNFRGKAREKFDWAANDLHDLQQRLPQDVPSGAAQGEARCA